MKTAKPGPEKADPAVVQDSGITETASPAADAPPHEDICQHPCPPEGRWFLTSRYSVEHGAAGRFVALTDAALAEAPEGLFVEPTAEQLAQRI